MTRVSYDAHLKRVLGLSARLAAALGQETVPLTAAYGRVSAAEITAPEDLPLFANSQMDGFAVGPGVTRGSTLPVIADIPAGQAQDGPLPPGTAARIMTGAAVPEGATVVVPVEWTDVPAGPVPLPEHVTVRDVPAEYLDPDGSLAAGTYIRPRGDDVHAGATLVRAGERLSARHVGTLGSLGLAQVRVRRRPRLAVLSTGSELVPPGSPRAAGQIWESNSAMLAALAAGTGDVKTGPVVAAVHDTPAAVAEAVDELTGHADVLLTSGGVSAGAFDETKAVLRQRDGMWFGSVAMQPGGPQGAGLLPAAQPAGADDPEDGDDHRGDGSHGRNDARREALVLALPGNPVSAAVSFEAFVRPALAALHGRAFRRRVHRLPAAEGFGSPAGKLQFARVRLHDDAVHRLGGPGSHLVAHLASADALALVPPEVTTVAPGDRLECWELED